MNVNRREFISLIVAGITANKTKAQLRAAEHILPVKAKVVPLKQEAKKVK